MNLYNKKYLYANGSSITAGGGFEEFKYRGPGIRDVYEDMGVTLPDTQVECSYPYFLAKNLGLTLINDAKSGSGINRLIRTTTQWIIDNEDKLNQTIMVLEPQVGIRLDWYVTEWDEYGIVNAHRNQNGEYPFTLVQDWFDEDEQERNKLNHKYESFFTEYFLNFYDELEDSHQESRRLINFLGYLNHKKIDYVVTTSSMRQDHQNEIDNILSYESNLNNVLVGGLWSYANDNKLLICDEIDNSDNHIGYFGNKHVADKITNFITKNKKITYYTVCSSISESNELTSFLTKNKSIYFDRTSNPENADFIFLGDFNSFNFGGFYRKNKLDDFEKTINDDYSRLKNTDVAGKRFLISLTHERIYQYEFVNFIEFLEDKFNIKKSQIWFIDLSYMEHPLTNHVPLELKIKQFLNIGEYQEYDDIHPRSKKIICLNNTIPLSRLLVFDRILHEYGNHEIMQDENIISMIKTDFGLNKATKEYLKNKISAYSDIGFPWKVDDFNRDTQRTGDTLRRGLNLHKQAIISITSETERIPIVTFNEDQNYQSFNDMQFSEKSLIPMLAGNFVFIIADGAMYRAFEKIGFDFSYLKKIFDIDYTTNTARENIEEVTKIVKFVKNKSIDELSELRDRNYHYIEHNRKLISDILYGDYNDNEIKFWERLSGKKLR